MNIRDSICVVTGATEGIGHATVFALAREGARLAVCARTATRVDTLIREVRDHKVTVVGQACDVASEESVERFRRFVASELGTPDVLINNAGLAHFAPVETMPTAQFDEIMSVNVRGVFLMTRAFLPAMRKRGGGHIVNVASLAGRNAIANGAAYAASKHAVLGFSKSLLMEVRKDNVRVAAVCPGTVVTPFFDKLEYEVENPERKLQPDDIAETIVAILKLPDRALISELDIRPTNP